MRVLSVCCFALLVGAGGAAAQNNLAAGAYLNALYCKGAVEVYAERLAKSSSSRYRSIAREARGVSGKLKSQAARLKSQYGIRDPRDRNAERRGRNVMAKDFPRQGAWMTGGPIPRGALRQYQHCVFVSKQ